MRRVYFIKPIGMDGPIKIGCSASPDGRRETLAKWCPFPLEIVAEIEGDLNTEIRFHGLFAEESLGREWFRASDRLLAVVEQVKAGAFDIACLPPYKRGMRPARKPANRDYMTAEWRYQRSVESRLMRRFGWSSRVSDEIRRIAGNGPFLPHKESIERLFDTHRECARPRRAA